MCVSPLQGRYGQSARVHAFLRRRDDVQMAVLRCVVRLLPRHAHRDLRRASPRPRPAPFIRRVAAEKPPRRRPPPFAILRAICSVWYSPLTSDLAPRSAVSFRASSRPSDGVARLHGDAVVEVQQAHLAHILGEAINLAHDRLLVTHDDAGRQRNKVNGRLEMETPRRSPAAACGCTGWAPGSPRRHHREIPSSPTPPPRGLRSGETPATEPGGARQDRRMCARVRGRAAGRSERRGGRDRGGSGGLGGRDEAGVGTRQRDTRTMRRTRAVSREARASDPRRGRSRGRAASSGVGRSSGVGATGRTMVACLARLPRVGEPCRRPGARRGRDGARLGFSQRRSAFLPLATPRVDPLTKSPQRSFSR